MNNNQNEFECALGCHDYCVPFERDRDILMCKNCKRKGFYEHNIGLKLYVDFDDKGNEIHWKNNCGREMWLDNDNKWTVIKPENWKYGN